MDAPCNTGHTYLGRQWEAIKTNTSGRWTIQHRHMWGDNGKQLEATGDNGKHVETTGDKARQEGRQGETRLREGGHTIQHRHTCGDNGRQFGNKTSGRRTHHPTQGAHMRGDNGREWGAMGDQGRQDLEKAGTPLKLEARERWKTTRGDKTLRRRTHHPTQTHIVGRQSETSGDKTSGRQTHHPTQAHVGRQWETMADKGEAREGRHTITGTHVERQSETKRENNTSGRQTHHPTQANVWGDNALNGTEGVRRGDETLGRRTRHPTQAHMWGDNERQDVRKADAPSNTDTHAGRQWETLGDKGETRHRECKHIIQHRHTCGDETTGEKWRQGTGTADTPTNKKEIRRETLGGRQRETRPRRTP